VYPFAGFVVELQLSVLNKWRMLTSVNLKGCVRSLRLCCGDRCNDYCDRANLLVIVGWFVTFVVICRKLATSPLCMNFAQMSSIPVPNFTVNFGKSRSKFSVKLLF